MSKPKHTPGPWYFDGLYVLQVDRATVIAEINHGAMTDIQCKANARLIAAAPEMLGALESVIKSKVLANKDNVELAKLVISAIVKARGES